MKKKNDSQSASSKKTSSLEVSEKLREKNMEKKMVQNTKKNPLKWNKIIHKKRKGRKNSLTKQV